MPSAKFAAMMLLKSRRRRSSEGWDAGEDEPGSFERHPREAPADLIIDNGNVAQTDAIEAALCLNIGVDENISTTRKR